MCAPQVGNKMEEKINFWQDLDELIESVSKQERIILGADLNEHVGEGNIGDEEVMGRYSAKTRERKDQWLWILRRGWIWRLSTLISKRRTNTG